MAEPKVTLHWLDKSRSHRILWLLHECNVKYELITYKRRKDMLAPKELKAVHPSGKSPVIVVEGGELTQPLVISESAAIVDYLIEHFAPHLRPQQWQQGKEGKVGGDTESFLRYRFLMNFAEGSLMPPLVIMLMSGRIRSDAPWLVRPITNRVADGIEGFAIPATDVNLGQLEDLLRTSPQGGKYICGPTLSGADIMLSFPLIAMKSRGQGMSKEKYPLCYEYTARLEEEPGYKKATDEVVAKTGSFVATL